MTEVERQPLLGKLVAAGFGGGRLEVMATTAVVFLLEIKTCEAVHKMARRTVRGGAAR